MALHKVGHTDLVFGVQSEFIGSLCMQDYKSLCAVVMTCAILVNIRTDTSTRTHTDSI